MTEELPGHDVESNDPFSPENLPIISYITTARVYDVLMALLKEQNSKMADDMLEAHAAGHLIMPAPRFSGVFISDAVNGGDDADQETDTVG